jgi:hypothetical protein
LGRFSEGIGIATNKANKEVEVIVAPQMTACPQVLWSIAD